MLGDGMFILMCYLPSGSGVDCRQFVDHGCLSYLIMALSSQCEEVRAASGHVLTRFCTQLEGNRFREKAQVRECECECVCMCMHM